MQYNSQFSNKIVRKFIKIFLFPLVLVGLMLRLYDKYIKENSIEK